MISNFKIKNFKSIGSSGVSLDLKPLTILVGPNGSGKSSILEALGLIIQSLKQNNIMLSGELVSFPSLLSIAHKNKTELWMSWEINLDDAVKSGFRYELCPNTDEKIQSILKNKKETVSIKLKGNLREGYEYIAILPEREQQTQKEKRHYVVSILDPQNFHKEAWDKKWEQFEEAQKTIEHIYNNIYKKIFFLNSFRGEVKHEIPIWSSGNPPRWIGVRGERLIDILFLLSGTAYEKQKLNILKWSKIFGLYKLSSSPAISGSLRAEYQDETLDTVLNLSLASHGTRQILSIIAQLFWSPENSLVMIEEPEISLHPEKQIEIVKLFAAAIKENKQQIIISTHSHFLQLALGIVAQKDLIKASDIALYEVTKDKEGTKVKSINLSKRGFLLGWPSSFDKVEKTVAREWFKGLEE